MKKSQGKSKGFFWGHLNLSNSNGKVIGARITSKEDLEEVRKKNAQLTMLGRKEGFWNVKTFESS